MRRTFALVAAGWCGLAAGAPPAVVAAVPAPPASTTIVETPAPARPKGGWWRVANRPICFDGGYRFEPRVRDLRYVPPTPELPGSRAGQREALAVLPPHRDGYFRLFAGR